MTMMRFCLGCLRHVPVAEYRNGRCRSCERTHERNRSAARRARSSMAWQKARAAARRRDHERCTSCGSTESLEVHHIVPLAKGGERFALSNLKTLCRECHNATRGGQRHRGRRHTPPQ
jgi:5-methylcytosine-specific restriction protein A